MQLSGESIVLPPGDYDNRELLPVDELKKKSELIRRKQEKLRKTSKKLQEATLRSGECGEEDHFYRLDNSHAGVFRESLPRIGSFSRNREGFQRSYFALTMSSDIE